uniref:FLYWCH-type domain-containing protein n=1 Tax=Syphacia muris TaxID=451379 RepID=A0A0N5A7X2_9BILA
MGGRNQYLSAKYPVEESLAPPEDHQIPLVKTEGDNNSAVVAEKNCSESSEAKTGLDNAQETFAVINTKTPVKVVVKCTERAKLGKKYRKGKRCNEKGKTKVIVDKRKDSGAEADSGNNSETATQQVTSEEVINEHQTAVKPSCENDGNDQNTSDSPDFVDTKSKALYSLA